MNRDPKAWARLGARMRTDRERQGLTRAELAARVEALGGKVTPRTITTLELGEPPKGKMAKPPSLEPTVAGLGWLPGSVESVLAGGEPTYATDQAGKTPERPDEAAAATVHPPERSDILELQGSVYEFSRLAVAAGADPAVRDEFDSALERLVASVPQPQRPRVRYSLAAYRPHALGEPIPEDDQERIMSAMEHGE